MKMITYERINNSYYKDKQLIDQLQVSLELPAYAFEKLQQSTICKVRQQTVETTYKANKKKYNAEKRKQDKQKAKDNKLLDKYKNLYITQFEPYKGSKRFALLRKNTKRGFYNFVTYLDDDTTQYINDQILIDIKKQLALKNKSNIDDSI